MIDAYGAQVVADTLDVTLRSIQNYVSEVKSTNPHENTARKIHEIYAKHTAGVPIKTEKKDAATEDYKDKYIALLEKQVHEKDERIAYLMGRLNSDVVELKEHLNLHSVYLKVLYQVTQLHRAKTEKEPLENIQKQTGKLYAEVLAGAS